MRVNWVGNRQTQLLGFHHIRRNAAANQTSLVNYFWAGAEGEFLTTSAQQAMLGPPHQAALVTATRPRQKQREGKTPIVLATAQAVGELPASLQTGDLDLSEAAKNVTALLLEWGRGKPSALDELVPLVYGELRRLADHYLRNERRAQTLQPTALVNEVYLKLVDLNQMEWQNRAQFFGVAANLMRQILVDHARARLAEKRGGGLQRLSLSDAVSFFEQKDLDLLALDDALTALARLDLQQCRVVELRFFGGLTIEETAVALGISPMTVKRDWRTAKLWLRREISRSERNDDADA
jgi:RNA polymerase sigma-70 factor, ECF subfamily